MKPQDRIRLYAQLSAAGVIVVWGLLCFVIIVAPRIGKLHRTEADLAKAAGTLQEMRKEIENASIIGQPAPGQSRFEKFGILGADEEELFLTDLIDFCKETSNTLDVVRRAETSRPAIQTTPGEQPKVGPTGAPITPASGQSAQGQAASGQQPAVPQPVIEKVPHTVTYSGTFLSSFYLLRKLESYKRLLTVERVEIGTDTRYGYPRVNGNVTIDLYLVRNPGQQPVAPVSKAAQTPAGRSASSAGRGGNPAPGASKL